MIPEGNVDSEGGGGAQSFPSTGNYADLTSGNYDSEFYSSGLNTQWFARNVESFQHLPNDKMDYYAKLGGQLQSALTGKPEQRQVMGGPQNADINSANLTGGFDNDWMAKRLDAGSANGAAIGGVGKNPGGGKIAGDGKMGGSGGYGGSGFGGPTVKNNDPSTLSGAGRLMN